MHSLEQLLDFLGLLQEVYIGAPSLSPGPGPPPSLVDEPALGGGSTKPLKKYKLYKLLYFGSLRYPLLDTCSNLCK